MASKQGLFFNSNRRFDDLDAVGQYDVNLPAQPMPGGEAQAMPRAMPSLSPQLPAPIMEDAPQQLQQQMPQQPQGERQGGGLGAILKMLAGGALDGVATHYGAQPGYSSGVESLRKYKQQVGLKQLEWQMRQREAEAERQAKRREPQTVGNNIVTMGEDGQYRSLYRQPTNFEDYATAQGLESGTPEYSSAVQDYVLRSSGPSALSDDKKMDDYRTNNRVRLEGLRQSNRAKLEGQRQGNRMSTRGSPTYRDANPLPRASRKANCDRLERREDGV